MLVSPGALGEKSKGHFKAGSNAVVYFAAVKSCGRAFLIGEGTTA